MTGYNPKVANISPAEFAELMAIVRAPPEEQRPRTPEAQWRADYRAAMNARRVIVQDDLFDARPVVFHRRHQRRPAYTPLVHETLEEKLERIEGDPFATFGPDRADRPAFLTDEQKAEIIKAAANWLRVGQRIRIVDAPGAVDPAYGAERFLGREGVVWRLCVSLTDLCYVYLDPVGGERAEKIQMVELRDLEPIE